MDAACRPEARRITGADASASVDIFGVTASGEGARDVGPREIVSTLVRLL